MDRQSFRSSLKQLFFASTFAFIISGCTSIDFKQPITSYNESMAVSGAILATYYSELNNQARDSYLIQAKYNQGKSLWEVEGGAKTAMVAFIPPEAIKVRLTAISLISQYGSKLALLAGSDAPGRVSTGIVQIGATYNQLAERFRTAPDIPQGAPSKDYATPIATIASVVGSEYLDSKRDALLMQAIQDGYPAVDKVLSLLEKDLPTIHVWATGKADDQMTDAMEYYNANKEKMSFEQRSLVLSEINGYARGFQSLVINQPQDVVSAMRDANKALLDYANNPGDDNRVVRLTSALETFHMRIAPIAIAMKKLKE